ncbi:MAG TPA: S1/P1 nuclease [Allosphingosinicella sp.]|nr:S1/P1 nuclease [Allosphingosinicella sp.]
MIKRLLFAALLFLAPAPAMAWWEYGHETVARIAWLEMSPQTRAELRRLMAQSRLLETPTCSTRTIEAVSYWPDCIKTLGARFSYASPWHYQNVDICQPFDLQAPCRDGNCVSAQIDRNLRLLADRRVPVRERLMAFAFLVHFMGDLHQPMHAGDHGDLGGNRVRVSYGIIPTNLHAAWDGYLADRGISQQPEDAAGILSELSEADRATMRQGDVTAWSREGWETAKEFAYGTILADPCALPAGTVPSDRPVITEEITRRLIPIIRRQQARGGLRLARLLDEAFQPDSPWLRPPERPRS